MKNTPPSLNETAITTIQVAKSMGITLSSDESWAIGSRVAKLWTDEMSRPPTKELRPKTSGGGTHCFAVYPLNWAARIKTVIKTVVKDTRGQGDLFGGAK